MTVHATGETGRLYNVQTAARRADARGFAAPEVRVRRTRPGEPAPVASGVGVPGHSELEPDLRCFGNHARLSESTAW